MRGKNRLFIYNLSLLCVFLVSLLDITLACCFFPFCNFSYFVIFFTSFARVLLSFLPLFYYFLLALTHATPINNSYFNSISKCEIRFIFLIISNFNIISCQLFFKLKIFPP